MREQNRIAAEEAELRKESRRRDQEKKKAKALDKRQQREAAERQVCLPLCKLTGTFCEGIS